MLNERYMIAPHLLLQDFFYNSWDERLCVLCIFPKEIPF